MNSKITTPTYIIIKMSKVKGRDDLKRSKRKTTCHLQGNSYNTTSRFFSRNFAGYRKWKNIFKVLKGKRKIIQNKNILPGKVIIQN